LLTRRGATITLAASGAQALTCFQGQRFDILLLDIQMPEMDGFTLLNEIRRRYPRMTPPALAVTAHAIKGDREACLAAGFAGYVAKPYNIAGLVDEILCALDASGNLEDSEETVVTELSSRRFAHGIGALDNDIELFDAAAKKFSAQAPRLVAALRESRADENFERVSSIAHQLKSIWYLFSSDFDRPLAESLDVSARERRPEAWLLATELADAIATTERDIGAWLTR
jgi:two-component system sensor histidine kinase/response regulator